MNAPDRYRIARETTPHRVEFLGIRHAEPWTQKLHDAAQWQSHADAETILAAMNAARPKHRLFIVSEVDTTDGPAHAEAVAPQAPETYDQGSTWDDFHPSRDELDRNRP